jgi:tRNA G46 methylase TrmB
VAALSRALMADGRLLVKSDHAGYADVIARVLAEAPDLRQIDPEEAFANLPITGFEHKYAIEGRQIFQFAYTRGI